MGNTNTRLSHQGQEPRGQGPACVVACPPYHNLAHYWQREQQGAPAKTEHDVTLQFETGETPALAA